MSPVRGRHRPGIVVALAVVIGLASLASGQDALAPEAAAPHATGLYQGANSCFRCHTQPTFLDVNSGVLDWCLLTEYSTWRTVDKHSMAYAVLEGPRGREMGEKLGVIVTRPEAGCLGCHAQNFPGQQLDPGFSYKDGVNCEVCHGPSGAWMTPHANPSWRLRSPAEKAELGLMDLRNPEVQSEICLSCHVGDAGLGRVVSHPMYAAGHPPLPSIDVARFARNIPQHWRTMGDVPWWDDAPNEVKEANGYDPAKLFETELTLVGNIVALREMMELLANRADLDSASENGLHRWPELALNAELRNDPRFGEPSRFHELARERWPEMAMTHSDCLACHHELRLPGWRQRRGFVAAPGRPTLRSFPTALIDLSIDQFGDQGDRSEFDRRLGRLNEAFTGVPFGLPGEVRDAARELARWADEFHANRLKPAAIDREAAPRLLDRLIELGRGQLHDYDTARQIASALQVIYLEWVRRGGDPPPDHPQVEVILGRWDEELNLGRYPQSDRRDALSLSILRDLASDPMLDGFAAWTPAALEYPVDPMAYWKASQNNPILLAFRNRVDPSQLRDAYVSDRFKEPLQEINNAGLRIALDVASRYDPYRFRMQLDALAALLPSHRAAE